MAVVWIPSLLRDRTGGRETVTVAAANMRNLIESLDAPSRIIHISIEA